MTGFIFESKEDIEDLYNKGDWNIICDFNKTNNKVEYLFKPKTSSFLEKDYEFLAHDDLKLKISYYIANEIKYFFDKLTKEQFETKMNDKILSNIEKIDHSGAGGSISPENLDTIINFIWTNKDDFNTKLDTMKQRNYLLVKTNTESDLMTDSFSIE